MNRLSLILAIVVLGSLLSACETRRDVVVVHDRPAERPHHVYHTERSTSAADMEVVNSYDRNGR